VYLQKAQNRPIVYLDRHSPQDPADRKNRPISFPFPTQNDASRRLLLLLLALLVCAKPAEPASDPRDSSRMLLRGGRRAALLLAAAAGVAGAGALARRDPDTAVYASASRPLRQALSAAAAEGLRSGTCLFSPWLRPNPYQGPFIFFPLLRPGARVNRFFLRGTFWGS
jgi:hypothetical protein